MTQSDAGLGIAALLSPSFGDNGAERPPSPSFGDNRGRHGCGGGVGKRGGVRRVGEASTSTAIFNWITERRSDWKKSPSLLSSSSRISHLPWLILLPTVPAPRHLPLLVWVPATRIDQIIIQAIREWQKPKSANSRKRFDFGTDISMQPAKAEKPAHALIMKTVPR